MFLKSVSLADQKVEDNLLQLKLEFRFLKSLSLADQKMETPDQKVETPKGRDTQTYVFEVSVTCWSKGGDNPPVIFGN